jgi:hypothetical protein
MVIFVDPITGHIASQNAVKNRRLGAWFHRGESHGFFCLKKQVDHTDQNHKNNTKPDEA